MFRQVSTGQRRTCPLRNSPRTTRNRSGHSTWGMWPHSGMRAREPSRRRQTASFAWDRGNTLSHSPHTTSVGISRAGRRSTSSSLWPRGLTRVRSTVKWASK